MLFDSRKKVKHLFRIFSRSLLRTLVKEIGWKFMGRGESLFGFKMGITIAYFQEERKIPEKSILLKRFSIKCIHVR